MDHPIPSSRPRSRRPHTALLLLAAALLVLPAGVAVAQETPPDPATGPAIGAVGSADGGPVGSLSEAWAAVLANPAMQRADAGLQAAEARASALDAAWDLSLGMGLRADVGATHPEGADPVRRDLELRLDPITLSLRFDGWPAGPRVDEREVTALRLDQQRQQLVETAARALIDTTEQYLAALRARQSAELQRQRAAEAAEALANTLLRVDLGQATDRDRREAELALLRAETELASAERQALQAREALERRLGRPVGDLADPGLASAAPALPDDPLTALEARASLRQARTQVVEAQQAAAGVQRSSGPQLSWQLSASAGDQDRRFDLGLAGSSADPRPRIDLSFAPQSGMAALQQVGDGTAWQAGAGLSLNIPLGPQGGHQREAAALDLLAAEIQAAEVAEDLWLELHDQWRAVEEAEGRLRLAEATLAARQADAEEEAQRSQLGLATPASLADSRLAAATALSDLLRAGDGLVVAHMRLALALALDPLEVLR